MNRKQRKLRWIQARNLMRVHKICNYGEFYCNHVYDPENPWTWVDARVFHSKLKRYFAVTFRTAEFAGYEIAEDDAWDRFEEAFPDQQKLPIKERLNIKGEYIEREISKTKLISTYARVMSDNGVSSWVDVVVNKEYIDEHVIREFVKLFREYGEPIKPTVVWREEAIEVIPAKINERYISGTYSSKP